MLRTVIIFLQCQGETITVQPDTTAPRILIINAFDASTLKARKTNRSFLPNWQIVLNNIYAVR